MVIYEQFTVGETLFNRAFSDRGVMIHGGVPEGDYSEACDPASFGRTYTETDIPIEGETDAEELLNILMGVEE